MESRITPSPKGGDRPGSILRRLSPYCPQIAKDLVDSFLAKRVHPQSLILKTWKGNAAEPSQKLCLFAHYDVQGQIAPYVLYYLECLKNLGAHTVLISTAPNLNDSEVSKALPYCSQVIQRKNLGLDFGSWKIGLLETPGWKQVDQLILANDSVYGPFFPLDAIFKRMEHFDFWGMTSSREKQYHLQSYFLVFGKKVLQNPAFSQFWEQFQFYRRKSRIIQKYELGISQLAKKQNWKMGAMVECSQIGNSNENPTLYAWDRLIQEFHFPFLKTEILKLGRVQSKKIQQWQEMIQGSSRYDIHLIRENLKELNAT